MTYRVPQLFCAIRNRLINNIRYLANVFRHRPCPKLLQEYAKLFLVAIQSACSKQGHRSAGKVGFIAARFNDLQPDAEWIQFVLKRFRESLYGKFGGVV